MEKFRLPNQVVVVGRIASVKTVNEADNGLFKGTVSIVTVETSENGVKAKQVFNIGETMSNSFAKTHLLFEGNYVSFTVDQCKANDTGYIPEGFDEMIPHTEDHDAVRDFFNASEDEIRNALYPDALGSAFAANSKIFVGLDVAAVAQISAQSANAAISESIARVIAKRDQHTLVVAASGSTVNAKSRAEVVAKQIEDLEKRIESAPEGLKKALKLRLDRLIEERDAA